MFCIAHTEIVISNFVRMIINAAVVVPAAEGDREEPHTLEQQRGHAVTQV